MKNDRELDIFRKYLERRGLKLTAERRALFDEVFARHEHVEADELLVRLRSKHKKISRATIYRTLELLADSGIVGKLRIGESGYRYERLRAGDHHDHLICKECGRVVEFYEPRIEELQDEVCERYGFILLDHSHQMRGICRQCRPRVKGESARRLDGSPPRRVRGARRTRPPDPLSEARKTHDGGPFRSKLRLSLGPVSEAAAAPSRTPAVVERRLAAMGTVLGLRVEGGRPGLGARGERDRGAGDRAGRGTALDLEAGGRARPLEPGQRRRGRHARPGGGGRARRSVSHGRLGRAARSTLPCCRSCGPWTYGAGAASR